MFKPLSQLNQFFKLAPEKTLSGSDQLVYLHLFNKFNQAHWTETILVRDAELLELINWYESNGKPTSIDTIRRAKARLKKKGFIEFNTTAAGTEYRMPRLYPADTPADPLAAPNIRAHEDVKSEEVKKLSICQRGRASLETGYEKSRG